MKYTLLLLALLLVGCGTTPRHRAINSLFNNGRDTYNSYTEYFEDYKLRTNAFPLIKQEYEVWQQLFSLTVTELPNTNGIPGVVSTGRWVIHHVNSH